MTITMPLVKLDLADPIRSGRSMDFVQDSLYQMPIEELDAVLDACEVPTGEYKLLLHILAMIPGCMSANAWLEYALPGLPDFTER